MHCKKCFSFTRREFRTAATSKMELFLIIINGFQPLTIITKKSILNVAAVLDPPLFVHPSSDSTKIEILESTKLINVYNTLYVMFTNISQYCKCTPRHFQYFHKNMSISECLIQIVLTEMT